MVAASPQNPAMQNMAARSQLIATGLAFTKRLPSQSSQNAVLGQTIRVPLDRTGIVTGVTLMVTAIIDITATATLSQAGPYSLIQNIQYVDFAGVKHINTSGYLLHALNCMKGSKLVGNPQGSSNLLASERPLDTAILVAPTAIANSQLVIFPLYIPLAYDPTSDLRGAVLAQTDRGEHYLTITFANALVNADPLVAPYTAGTAVQHAATNITIDAYQHYLMPQAGVGPGNLPMIDLGTIYEVAGGTIDSANIVAGAAKYLNWPNNRAILSVMHFFDQAAAGGTLNGADLTQLTVLINGNTNVREMGPEYLRMQMRYRLATDLASGLYYIEARRQPITTQLYGNVQTKADIVTAGANSYFMNQYESFYLSGTPLPGVIQS